ncbi:MAG: ABC transporter substrate-binding protein [Deltaproteobacteria bacterium]|nr:ABC transporter substrate-binding protein [Deltaproteobacteria bacterium]MBN2673087.1 ABC transporter substrate-binding protein [Deltaproteobacteria bacterium]
MRLFKTILAIFTLTIGISGTAFAAVGPTEYLKSLDSEMKPLLVKAEQNKTKILKIVKKMLDFDRLCKDSLGKHWETRTAEQQTDFSKTLTALIEKNILQRLKDTKSSEIVYESEKVKGDKATVVTIVTDNSGARPVDVEIAYTMEKKGNKWIVVDMKTDGISLVSNYRSQFNNLIEKEGWDQMMKKMKDKLAE